VRIRAVLVVVLAGCGLTVPPNVDRDNDLRRDVEDNCPSVPNQDQSDYDHDGMGDACDECVDGGDADEDADGIPDGCDGCVSNGEDDDGDSIPDNCDACVGNGIDKDSDGIPDNCDTCVGLGVDSDGDGIDDACDPCVGSSEDVDQDGIEDGCDMCLETYVDADHDEIDDGCDTCVANNIDGDNDGLGDNCDPCPYGPQHDEDQDSWFDACDNCPTVANPGQEGSLAFNSDGLGTACDPEPSEYNLQQFDGFDRQDPNWYIQGSGWLVANDRLFSLSSSATPVYRSLGTAQQWFSITTVVHPSGTPGTIRIYAADAELQPALNRIECELESSGLASGILVRARTVEGGNTPVESLAAAAPVTFGVQLTMVVDMGTKTLTCDANGVTVSAQSINPGNSPWSPGLSVTDTLASFDYFYVVTRL